MTVIFESGLNEPPADWIELTEADVATVTFQNTGTKTAYIQATAGDAPTTTSGTLTVEPGAGEVAVALADLFPGVASADRLWAYANAQTQMAVSHAPSTNRTVTLSATADFTTARIAHANNWLTGGTVTASSTATDYFEDGPDTSLTYEKWKPSSLAATWEYDHGSAAECDYCVIGAHTLGTNGNTLQVQYHDGSSWVDLVPTSAITTDEPIFVLFTAQTRQRWRISISNGTTPEIGVVKFGKALAMQRPIYGGHTPIPMARQTILRSNKSETGEFLGRSRQRTYLATSYEWQHLTAAWVRANWPSFQQAIEEEPFFIAWRPATFGDVALVQTDQVPVPQNMGIRDLMSVSLSVVGRGYE